MKNKQAVDAGEIAAAAAVLPLFPVLQPISLAFESAAAAAIVSISLTLVMPILRVLFPRYLFQFSILLTLCALGQLGGYFFDLPPYWILSAVLLLPFRIFEAGSETKPENNFVRTIKHAAGFAFLVLIAAGAAEFLGERGKILFFLRPAGIFLMLGAGLLLWKNQPGRPA